jgi:hypothetical protein
MQRILNVGVLNINTANPGYSSLEKTLSIIEKNKYSGLDILVGPEWSLMNNNVENEKPYSPGKFRDTLAKIKDASRYSNTLIIPGTAVIHTKENKMYNILPVVYKGQIIFSTIKKADGGTSFFDINNNYELIGEDYKIRNTFYWKGIKIGIEICADSGTLHEQGENNLNIQILSSSGVRNTTLAIKENGYLICADGNRSAGRKVYVIRKSTDQSDVNVFTYMDLLKSNGYTAISGAPFEFLPVEKKHQNMNVYRIEMELNDDIP